MQVYQQNFDALTDGTINGQDSWTVDSTIAAVVQTSVKYAGAKALEVSKVSNNGYAYRHFTNTADGRATFYVRTADASAYFQIYLRESYAGGYYSRTACCFTGGKIKLNCGAGYITVLANPASNTWYKIEIEWRSSDKKVRMRVDGGTWSNWYASGADGGSATVAHIGDICCFHWTGNTVHFFVDSVLIEDTSLVPFLPKVNIF